MQLYFKFNQLNRNFHQRSIPPGPTRSPVWRSHHEDSSLSLRARHLWAGEKLWKMKGICWFFNFICHVVEIVRPKSRKQKGEGCCLWQGGTWNLGYRNVIAQNLGGFFHLPKPEVSGFLKKRCLNERSFLEEAGSKGLMKIHQRRYYSEHFLCAKWAVPSRSPKISVQPQELSTICTAIWL